MYGMRDARLVQLFERYRSEGDAEALAEVFDEVAPALLKVARHIDGRAGEAEDLVQATFLVAIERASAYDAARPLVPWLMGILINQSRLSRRRRSRMDGGVAEEKHSTGDQGLDVENRELALAVVAALRELPEVYQQVLLPLLTQGLKPGEIADMLGRPHGTVRAQIHRGLRMIRRILPSSFALGAAATLTSRESLALARQEILQAARERAREMGRVPGASTKIVASSGRSVVQKYALASVALLLGLAAWMLVRDVPVGRGAGTVVGRADLALDSDRMRALERSTETNRSRAAIEESAGGAAALPYGSVLVRVTRGEDRVPAVGRHVTLLAWGEPDWYAHVVETVTDAEGSVLVPHVHAGRVGVHIDHGQQFRRTVAPGEQQIFEIQLPRGLDVAGRVIDREGKPIGGAAVEAGEREMDAAASSSASRAQHCTTHPDGTFALADVDRGSFVCARARGRAPSDRYWLGSPRYREQAGVEIEIELAEPGAVLSGRVMDPAGVPVAGARVVIAHELAEPGNTGAADATSAPPALAPRAAIGPRAAIARAQCSADGSVRIEAAPIRVSTDAHGRFTSDGVPDGTVTLTVEAPGFAPWSARVTAQTAALDDILVHLTRGVTLAGTVRTRDGRAAAGAIVTARSPLSRSPVTALSGEDGEYILEHVPPGQVVLSASARGFGEPTSATFLSQEGESARWDAVIDPEQVIEGTVIGPDGRPMKIWLVKAVPEEATATPPATDTRETRSLALERSLAREIFNDPVPDLLQCWTDDHGHFRVPCRGGVPHKLELRPRQGWSVSVRAMLTGVRPGTRDVVLHYTPTGASLRGRVVLPDSAAALPCDMIAIRTQDGSAAHFAADATTGEFEFGPLPAGEYELVAWAAGCAPQSLGRHELTQGSALDLGVRRIERGE
jgi:RNA polymerase sigma-70 factor (ECF subfamily)